MTDGNTSFAAFTLQWQDVFEERFAGFLALPEAKNARLPEAMRYSALSPGKRLRPLLCLAACHACGGNPETAMPAAAAVEMVHAFSLIHDDLPCMDDDELRRGRPTCHVVYGEALALLAGDALLAHAFTVLADELEPRVAAACCKELSAAAGPLGMTEGQAMDMEGVPAGEGFAFLEALHGRKTGALLVAALRMGGIVAGASPEQLSALTAFGSRLGLAFQIIDDVIDATGTAEEAGKAVGKDAAQGKKTSVAFLGVQGARAKAEQLMADGLQALVPFGPRAQALRDAGERVLTRSA